MTNNDITRWYYNTEDRCMEPDDDGDYVTYEDHVEALAKARDNALVEASETLSGLLDMQGDNK